MTYQMNPCYEYTQEEEEEEEKEYMKIRKLNNTNLSLKENCIKIIKQTNMSYDILPKTLKAELDVISICKRCKKFWLNEYNLYDICGWCLEEEYMNDIESEEDYFQGLEDDFNFSNEMGYIEDNMEAVFEELLQKVDKTE